MIDLKAVIRECFEGYESYGYYRERNMQRPSTQERNMVVPISFTDTFELPTFMMSNFMPMDVLAKREDFAFVTTLKTYGKMSSYKSLDAIMRESLQKHFPTKRLVCITEDLHDPLKTYYATQGAIFDCAFNPIMMMMWQVKAEKQEDNTLIFEFIKPILRVAPHVFIQKADSVQRYIINKIIPTALEISYIHKPRCRINPASISEDYQQRCSVEIDRMPFFYKRVDIPSVSTTNEMLLNIAFNHVEEAV